MNDSKMRNVEMRNSSLATEERKTNYPKCFDRTVQSFSYLLVEELRKGLLRTHVRMSVRQFEALFQNCALFLYSYSIISHGV